jgi:hypothetical protein
MPWDYRAVEEIPAGSDGAWVPLGLKIIKTFTDDSGVELVTVDATLEDAVENSEEGFDVEYYEALKVLATKNLATILESSDSGSINFSLGSILGRKLEQNLATARVLREGFPN